MRYHPQRTVIPTERLPRRGICFKRLAQRIAPPRRNPAARKYRHPERSEGSAFHQPEATINREENANNKRLSSGHGFSRRVNRPGLAPLTGMQAAKGGAGLQSRQKQTPHVRFRLRGLLALAFRTHDRPSVRRRDSTHLTTRKLKKESAGMKNSPPIKSWPGARLRDPSPPAFLPISAGSG